MDITNKTLGLLLIAAIVVSLGGTFVSLNKLGGVSTTGYATQNDSGTVTLAVGSAVSIRISSTNEISFGTCVPDISVPIHLDSSQDINGANNSACLTGGGTFPDNITLENDGNVNANVTIISVNNGTTLFTGGIANDGGLAYRANHGGETGCSGGDLQTDWKNFTITDTPGPTDENPVCDVLAFGDGADEIVISALIRMPASVTDVIGSTQITLIATESGV